MVHTRKKGEMGEVVGNLLVRRKEPRCQEQQKKVGLASRQEERGERPAWRLMIHDGEVYIFLPRTREMRGEKRLPRSKEEKGVRGLSLLRSS